MANTTLLNNDAAERKIMKPREELIAALELGLEHTQTALSRHEVDLGRTTYSNKAEAETLEDELRQIQGVIELIKSLTIGRWVSVEERLPEFKDRKWKGIFRRESVEYAGVFNFNEFMSGDEWLELELPNGGAE